ncbi:MAG: response regulator [Planctomycetales bacterium]|nr:response regulator [Planctomycetales bacterium]
MSAQMLELPETESCEVAVERPVLIVEDDESIAEVLSIRLNRQGFQTFVAHNGHQGLREARRHRPRLILLDIRLPDIDGFQICQQIDEDPATCGTPVIILSGMERPDIIRRSRAVGCTYFVRKPYDPNALLVLIDAAMRETD